jgi:hypothetical protein
MPANHSSPSAPNGASPATPTTPSSAAFFQQRGACQGVRSATGVAHECEPVDAQRIGDGSDLRGS